MIFIEWDFLGLQLQKIEKKETFFKTTMCVIYTLDRDQIRIDW